MRNSLKKLRAGFGIPNKNGGGKIRRLPEPGVAQLDGLARATQDMRDMRDCYDSLLSAAAATANSAYEFSESLKEMGSCLLAKTALNDDEESGEVLLMMGKVQFELQKLVDKYRSHIFQTIISPSESLLNELRIVEEMKRLCDEKRTVYEHMKSTCREKGRSKSKKGASFSAQELQTAYDEYDEEATLFVFRLKSLKQGQSRSLLTQAARHHASQSYFFRKGLKSLEAVEPHVKLVTTQQHIDYQFSGLDDSNTEDDSYDEDDYEGSVSEVSDGELSYEYEPNVKEPNTVSRPTDSMLLDKAEFTLPQVATKENSDRPGRNSSAFGREKKASSQSAPLFAEKKFDPAERVRQMRQLSSRRFHSYVLPTPVEPRSPVSTKPDPQVFPMRQSYMSSNEINYRHSSPLVQRNYEKISERGKRSAPLRLSQPPALRESNAGNTSTSLTPPLAEELSSRHHDQHSTSHAKKTKRQAFSGPLTDKSWPNKRGLASTGPLDPAGPPKLFSGPLLRTPVPHRSTSPKLSPSASPTFVSSPKISELHELPRPPLNKLAGRLSSQVGNSGPLIPVHKINTINRLVPKSASLLPPPPLRMARSFSIPSRAQKVTGLPMAMPLGIPQTKSVENLVLPSLSPLSPSTMQPTSPAS